jgi:hypothetical protein
MLLPERRPTLQTYVANPNHTVVMSWHFRESIQGTKWNKVLNVLAIDILKQPDSFLTDILLQAEQKLTSKQSIYRNYFMQNRMQLEIAIIASEDTHYSIPKAANLLMLDWLNIPVDFDTRLMFFALKTSLSMRKKEEEIFYCRFKYGTTMFGAVDNPDDYTQNLENNKKIQTAY